MARRKPYVLNVESRILHRVPTKESCNMDQAPRKRYTDKLPGFDENGRPIRRCRHCFRDSRDIRGR